MKVLHVTEALGGGVSTAILNYQALTPEMHHCVIARERAGQSTYNFPPSELSVTLVPGSLAALLLSAIRMVRRGRFRCSPPAFQSCRSRPDHPGGAPSWNRIHPTLLRIRAHRRQSPGAGTLQVR